MRNQVKLLLVSQDSTERQELERLSSSFTEVQVLVEQAEIRSLAAGNSAECDLICIGSSVVHTDCEQKLNSLHVNVPVIVFGRDVDLLDRALNAGVTDCLLLGQSAARHFRRILRYASHFGHSQLLADPKSALAELNTKTQLLNSIVDSSPLGLATLDAEGLITSWNRAAERIFRRNAAATVGKKLNISGGRLTFGETDEILHPAMSTGIEVVYHLANNISRDISISFSPLKSNNGEICGSVASFEDITYRKQMERSVRESEAIYHELFERNVAAVVLTSIKGEVLKANSAMVRLLGYELEEEVLKRTVSEFLADQAERDRIYGLLRSEGQIRSHELRIRKRNGTIGLVLANTHVVKDEAGKPVFAQSTMIDIAEYRTLQEQLVQAQKMEALGQLVGGVAHDFNNITMIVNSYCELLTDYVQTEPTASRFVTQIRDASRRAGDLTKQLLSFSRKNMLELDNHSPSEIVSSITAMLPRLLGSNIKVNVHDECAKGFVKVDRSHFEQVIINLAVNARDAMPTGGELTISIASEVLSSHSARSFGLPGGRYIELKVSDTGTGIPTDVLPRIFEPFFTTKPEGKGTGLGLSTVYGIVKQSGGHTSVDSQIGRGTTFTILLPEVSQKRVDDAASKNATITGHETVLLAEDEQSVRNAASEFLRSQGYRVLTASDGREAVEVASAHDGKIDIVVTDVVMPKLTGPEAVQLIQESRPDIKTLYMSAFNESPLLPSKLLDRGSAFLHKPCSLSMLAGTIRSLVEGTERRVAEVRPM